MKKILQAFEKLFSKREAKQIVYICDFSKADTCSKEGCWYISQGPCKCTSKKKNAKLDENGKPIVATDLDIWNSDWYELQIDSIIGSQKKQGL